jgi:hypothetical protein
MSNTKKTPAKKRGRPSLPKGHVKGKIVPMRLTNAELKLFSKATKADGHDTLSSWMRHTLNAAAERHANPTAVKSPRRAFSLTEDV